jgi:hypothetical protein
MLVLFLLLLLNDLACDNGLSCVWFILFKIVELLICMITEEYWVDKIQELQHSIYEKLFLKSPVEYVVYSGNLQLGHVT